MRDAGGNRGVAAGSFFLVIPAHAGIQAGSLSLQLLLESLDSGEVVLSLHAIPLTLLATAISFLWAFVSGSRRSFGTFLLVSLATLGNVLFWSWFLRDGMGPDAITTYGWQAWQRFRSLAAVPVIAWAALAIAAGLRYWHAARSQCHMTARRNQGISAHR